MAQYNLGGMGCIGGCEPGLQILFTVTAADFIAPAVPEPSTWAMLLIGFVGIGFAAYRKRGEKVFTSTPPRPAPKPAQLLPAAMEALILMATLAARRCSRGSDHAGLEGLQSGSEGPSLGKLELKRDE